MSVIKFVDSAGKAKFILAEEDTAPIEISNSKESQNVTNVSTGQGDPSPVSDDDQTPDL